MIKKIISGLMFTFLTLLLIGVSIFAIQLIPMTLFNTVDAGTVGLSKMSQIFLLIGAELFFILVILGIINVMVLVYLYFKNLAYTSKFIKGLNKLIALSLITSVVLIGFGVYIVFATSISLFDLMMGVGFILVIWILAAVIALVRVIVLDTIEFKDENELVV